MTYLLQFPSVNNPLTCFGFSQKRSTQLLFPMGSWPKPLKSLPSWAFAVFKARVARSRSDFFASLARKNQACGLVEIFTPLRKSECGG